MSSIYRMSDTTYTRNHIDISLECFNGLEIGNDSVVINNRIDCILLISWMVDICHRYHIICPWDRACVGHCAKVMWCNISINNLRLPCYEKRSIPILVLHHTSWFCVTETSATEVLGIC